MRGAPHLDGCICGRPPWRHMDECPAGQAFNAEHAYLHDPLFHALVTRLEELLDSGSVSEAEMRHAVHLACVRHHIRAERRAIDETLSDLRRMGQSGGP